jgi:glycosyltransferase involved in cell wall biosynthesis
MPESVEKKFPSVLIVVENLPVPFDRRVWLEATSLRDAGYEVSVICPTGKGFDKSYEELDGIYVYRHPLPPEPKSAVGYLREYLVALYWEARLAHRIWKERGFKLIHICNPPDLLFLIAAWYKRRHKVRVIFDHHDASPELYEEKYGRRDIFYYLIRLAERLTFLTADVVLSTNASYAAIAVGRGRKRPESVHVVRSAPDLDTFTEVSPNYDHKRGRPFLVGYLGVMAKQDGLDYLLYAVHHIVWELGRQDVQFQLIGGGPALDELKALAKRLGISDHVDFVGYRTGIELLERLSTCDVCVSPDPATDYNTICTMNKVLEYMAIGKPQVQFDLLEGRRSAGAAALYARNNDPRDLGCKVLKLIDNPELGNRMGRCGKARMREELSWEHQVSKLLSAYESAWTIVRSS